jgi:hypothetical protein
MNFKIMTLAILLGGCAGPLYARTPIDNGVVTHGRISGTSKPQYAWKADMSNYMQDSESCAEWAFWGTGFNRSQNYRFCMQRRGYTMTIDKPLLTQP